MLDRGVSEDTLDSVEFLDLKIKGILTMLHEHLVDCSIRRSSENRSLDFVDNLHLFSNMNSHFLEINDLFLVSDISLEFRVNISVGLRADSVDDGFLPSESQCLLETVDEEQSKIN